MEVSPDEEVWFDILDALFGSLLRGSYGEFLAGCANDLVLNVRGSAQLATRVPKSEVPQWHRSMQQLAGSSFQSSVCFILITKQTGFVVLTHTIERCGLMFRYETVNHCVLRGNLLSSWFSYPLDAETYAEAWGLQKDAVLQPA